MALAISFSCKKQLNQQPTNAIPTSDALQTVGDFEAAAKGMYFQMVHADNYLAGQDDPIAWVSTLDLIADNLIAQTTGRGSQTSWANWRYNRTNASGMFGQGYKIIRSANAILENIDRIDGTGQKDNIEGEALAVRAMVHFDLLRVYCKPVSGPQADLNGLGIPYVTTTDISDMPSRGNVKEAYDLIVDDMKKAADLIDVQNGVGRLNKAAVYGLLSRIYLYGGEMEKCITAADDCLALSGPVAEREDFPDVWKDQTEDGVLFKVVVTPQDRNNANDPGTRIQIGTGYGQSFQEGIKSEWVCSYSLFQMYDTTDIRKDAYLIPTQYGGIEYNAIRKYLGRPGDPLGMVDIKYLRVAEVLLNRAEAHAVLGNDPLALADLDEIRSERYDGFNSQGETGQALKDAIQLERRLELAFEGDRWFTLKRLGLGVHRDSFGDQGDGTGTPSIFMDLEPNDNRWQIPIHFSYIQANPNLKQNPGY